MKIGIIGLPNVGKKTVFELLTGEKVSEQSFATGAEVKRGIAHLRDSRFDRLVELYQPAKRVPATLEIILLPRFDKETVASGELLKAVEKCDALCHIVRAFHDEAVFHVEGSVNVFRDIDMVTDELILADLMLIEKRLERIAKEMKGGGKPQQIQERELLQRMKTHLDGHLPLMTFSLDTEQQKALSTYQFLTRKPLLVILNVDDVALTDQSLLTQVVQKYESMHLKAMHISAKIEAELSALAPEERAAFLQDLHITESALHQLTRLYYDALGLISFYTVGEDEVRAWAVHRGASAPEAAGVIHSDMQRGFIRAEIMMCADLFELGSEAKVKEAGKYALKGKDYILNDGDIMYVRFSV